MRFGLFIILFVLAGFSAKASCELHPKFSYQTRGLTVSFTNKSAGDYQMVEWLFSDGTVSNEVNPQHTFSSAGRYTFSLTVSNPEGCSETFEGKVYVFNIKHKSQPQETLPGSNQPATAVPAVAESARNNAGNALVSNAAIKLISSLTNIPNPFRVATNIMFELAENSRVQVSVYDLNGRLVRILVNEIMNSGTQNVPFERNNLPSGTYMVVVNTADSSNSRKIMIN